MSPVTTDYPVMPERTAVAEGKKERKADLVLGKLADLLVMSSQTSTLVVTAVGTAGLVGTGLSLRPWLAPRGWGVAAACALLVAVVLAVPARRRRRGKQEPKWARAAFAHEQSTWERLPEGMRTMLRDFTASMTAGTRWQDNARVYVARCTEEQEDEAHWAPCCTGGTMELNGRLLVILGEHLAVGPLALAGAVLAHERRHVSGWRLYPYVLAAFGGDLGLVIIGWAVTPWPVMLLAAVALRVAKTAITWAVEIGCDVGAAREKSAAAMLSTVDYLERTQGGTRALQPPAKRWALSVLTWLTGPGHPPYGVRRAAIRGLAGNRTAGRTARG